MVYHPTKPKKGKHYKVYKRAKELVGKEVKSKAQLLREALKKAEEIEEHADYIDFIPAKFSLQLHGWFDVPDDYKNLSEIQAHIKELFRKYAWDKKVDISKQLKGKWHWDLRIKKETAPCYDKETEVLTDKGWKFFKDVELSDKIAEYKPDSQELVFSPHQGKYEVHYSGEMIGAKGEQLDFLVTPDHRMFFNNRIGRAIDIYGKTGNFRRWIKHWKGRKISLDFAEFLGFWFAEGSVTSIREKNPYQYPVLTNSDYDYVCDLLNRNNFQYRVEKRSHKRRRTVYNFVIKDRKLGKELATYGKALTKRIPVGYRRLSQDALRAFVTGFTKGDGHKRKKDWVLFTSSKGLADDLQEICTLAGYVANLRSHRTKISFSQKPKFKISITKNRGHFPYIDNSKKGARWFKQQYNDKVYCVEMPGNPLILTRRHGITLIAGRTWFGLTGFGDFWKGTPEDKTMGTVKGYTVLAPGGKHLQRFLAKEAEAQMAKEGIAERRDRIEWMKVKAQWFPPMSPGNPQKKQTAAMVAVEYYKPACLHRRELDFIDCTFFGQYLKGRYYNRLVERKMSKDEMTEWQKKAVSEGKVQAFYNLAFYFWKAKDQWGESEKLPYTMEQVRKAALGKITLDKIPAPKRK